MVNNHISMMNNHISMMHNHISMMNNHISMMNNHISMMNNHISMMNNHISMVNNHISMMNNHISMVISISIYPATTTIGGQSVHSILAIVVNVEVASFNARDHCGRYIINEMSISHSFVYVCDAFMALSKWIKQ